MKPIIAVFTILFLSSAYALKLIQRPDTPKQEALGNLRGGIDAQDANPNMMIYQGGRIITKPNIVPVFMSLTYPDQSKITHYYQALMKGNFIDFLQQYRVSKNIMDGTVTKPYSFDWTNLNSQFSIDQAATWLFEAIYSNQLPQPSNNTMYALHFQGSTDFAGGSCTYWCGIHGSLSLSEANKYAYFALIPDFASIPGCVDACGGNIDNIPVTSFNAIASTVSHEIAEIITDPDVMYGQVTWASEGGSEVADDCGDRMATIELGDRKKHPVQMLWSNKSQKCTPPKKGK